MKRFDSDWSPICRRRAGQFRVLISAIEGGHHGDRWRKQGLLMQILFHDPLTSSQRNNSILNLAFEFRWTSSCMQTCGWPQSNPHSRYSIYRQGLAARAKWTASRPGSWGGRLQNETTKQGRSHFASACLIAWYYVAAFDSVENLAGRRGSQRWQRRWQFWRCCPRNWPCSI